MSKYDPESEQVSLAFKKSTEDKLAWKLEIASAARDCRKAKGTFHFKNKVEALTDIIYFNIPGYYLADEIEKIKKKLKQQRTQKITDTKKRKGRKYYKHAFQAIFKIQVEKWYWDEYFKKIIQLLGTHNLLFDTEKYIKIKEVREFHDTEDE